MIKIFYYYHTFKYRIIKSFENIITILSLIPFPLYKGSNKNNLLSKIFLYIFPFYIILTRCSEVLFLIIVYNYLQIRFKISRKNLIYKKEDKFNLIDIFIYIFIMFYSFFSFREIEDINSFDLFEFFEIIIPLLLVSITFYEICKLNKYFNSNSLFVLIGFMDIMNIRLFLNIKDDGSLREIGMSIALFIINNAISFIQIILFFIPFFIDC